MRVYFAHPISTYGTEVETKAIETIKRHFAGYVGEIEVVNPGLPVHQEPCRLLHMEYFLAVVRKCEAIVGMPFSDGEYGSGVYDEMKEMGRAGGEVWSIDPTGTTVRRIDHLDIRPLSIAETKRRIKGAKK